MSNFESQEAQQSSSPPPKSNPQETFILRGLNHDERKEGRTRGWCGGGAAPTNKNARFLSAAQTELECGGWTKWGGVLEATCDLINKPVQGIILRQELRVTSLLSE